MRKLVTIRKIAAISPITGADLIDVATIDGWKVVIKKNEFSVGDEVLYFEIDSFIPHTLAPWLTKGDKPSEFNGVQGERLRTVKLRGQISQGLVLPLSALDQLDSTTIDYDDLASSFGVVKYEVETANGKNVNASIPKTEKERIQNLTHTLESLSACCFCVTEKLDGSSMTVYHNFGDVGVCSAREDLHYSENNRFWKAALDQNLISKVKSTGRNLAFQGELIGEKIQGNKYNLTGNRFYLFNVHDIDQGRNLRPSEMLKLASDLALEVVPVIDFQYTLPQSIDQILDYANGASAINTAYSREGLVLTSLDGQHSFKAISNKWLLKHE